MMAAWHAFPTRLQLLLQIARATVRRSVSELNRIGTCISTLRRCRGSFVYRSNNTWSRNRIQRCRAGGEILLRSVVAQHGISSEKKVAKIEAFSRALACRPS